MERLIDEEKLMASEDSYWANLMNVPYNKKLYQPVEPRVVNYCIFDPHPASDFESIKQSFESLKSQTYMKWTAVYYLNQTSTEHKRYSEGQKKLGYEVII